ncbi:inner centromere protein [Brachypodium distachyon]|uniref:inner centromere protein n=1 Tax=Brachypodium distachyon TaxID=15368 RepID=UPI00071D094B|nr:inner centromere protein [Brachypodium distachyon]|eukprot:XP_014754070.1 inner centromere protein [Brachypodium distachyon]
MYTKSQGVFFGIGPSPADLRIPGGQKLKSTKLQLAEEETKQAWRANEALKEQVDDIQHGTQLRIDALTEELSQLKNLIVGNLTSQVIPAERADSVGESVAVEEHIVYNVKQEEQIQRDMMEAQEVFEKKKHDLLKRKKEAAIREQKEADQLQQKKKQELECLEKKEAALKQNKEAAALRQKKKQELELLENRESALKQNKAAADLQQKKNHELEPSKNKEAAVKQNKAAAAHQQKKKNPTQGKDVILYNGYQNHATPVAKATVLSTDRKKVDVDIMWFRDPFERMSVAAHILDDVYMYILHVSFALLGMMKLPVIE